MALGDLDGLSEAMHRYVEVDPSFAGCREASFMEDLTQACLENDDDSFTQVVAAYDSMSRLDPWKTTMLLRVKRNLQGVPVQESGGGGGPGGQGGRAGGGGVRREAEVPLGDTADDLM